jgi:hypothetical protein
VQANFEYIILKIYKMGKNNENENVHVERQDNTRVRRPVLQERF